MSEIESCPDCYTNACIKKEENWFVLPCVSSDNEFPGDVLHLCCIFYPLELAGILSSVTTKPGMDCVSSTSGVGTH